MDDFRDDGTRVCPVHGLRYDPELSTGCIKCAPVPSQRPRKKSTSPPKPRSSSVPDALPSLATPPVPPSYGPPPRRSAFPSTPMPPIEPFAPSPGFGAGPFGASGPAAAGPKITILAAPDRPKSRRALIRGIGLLFLVGTGGAVWFLRPESATDWSKKIIEFRYGPSGTRTGAIFVPSNAGDEPRPLLVVLDFGRRPVRACARFAKHCEQHGWIAVSSDVLGREISTGDAAEVSMLLEEARSHAKIDASRPILAGFDVAADIACRLALVQPDTFGGAILEDVSLGPWRDAGALAQNDQSFFLAARTGAKNHEAMLTMKDEMERKGLRVTWSDVPGGDEPLERDELDAAFAWLDQLHG